MAAEKLIGSCLEVTSVILQIWKGVKRRSWGLLSVLGWCNVSQSDRFLGSRSSNRSTGPKQTGIEILSRKRDGSEAESLFHPPWKKQKLKTDSAVSSHRSRQLMKTTTPKHVGYRHKSQNYPRSPCSQRVHDSVPTVWWLKRTRPSPPKTLLLLWDTPWRRQLKVRMFTQAVMKLVPLSNLFTAAGGLTSCVLLFFLPSQRCREPGLASRPCYQDGDAQEAR